MAKSNEPVAFKSTEMIQLKGNILKRDFLTETEQKAVMYIASQVKQESKPGDTYFFEYKKFAEIAGIGINGRLYKEMTELIYGLQTKRVMFRVEQEKGVFSATMVISPRFYDSGIIEYEIDKNLLPHFKAFAAGFTMIDVTDYMRIRGKHPLTLYELMLSWIGKKQVEYTIEELRNKMCIAENAYPKNFDFIRQLRIAVEEINYKSRKIKVEMEEVTGARKKVESVIFKIKLKRKTLEEKLEERTGQLNILDKIDKVTEEVANEIAATSKDPAKLAKADCPKCNGTGRYRVKDHFTGQEITYNCECWSHLTKR